jgi:hypothetical protein
VDDSWWSRFIDWVAPSIGVVGDANAVGLTVAVAVALVGTANLLVRLLLQAATRAPADDAELKPASRIRGGRVIGPLERLLLVGFVLTGNASGAAVIVAAKSLLRYPELNAQAANSRGGDSGFLHEATEYIVLGSLASWACAFGGAWLITVLG